MVLGICYFCEASRICNWLNSSPIVDMNQIGQKEYLKNATRGLLIPALALLFVLTGFMVLSFNENMAETISKSYILPIENLGLWFFLILAVLCAPIIEEICFRLWIRDKYYWGILLMMAFILVSFEDIYLRVSTLILVASILLYFKKLKHWLRGHPTFVLLISAMLFSLVHSVNFKELHFAHFWLFLVFLGLGMIFGLARLRFGLWAAILLHFAYNFMVTAPLLPSLTTTHERIGNATFTAHGVFDSENEFSRLESKICLQCSREKLIQSVASKIYPDDIVVFKTDDNSFAKYSMESDLPFDYNSIMAGLEQHFQLRLDTTSAYVKTIQISLKVNPEFAFNADNVLKHRPKSMNDRMVTGLGALRAYFEKNYQVKINCIENCEEMLVFPVSDDLSLEENLLKLSNLDILTYAISESELRVVTISSM